MYDILWAVFAVAFFLSLATTPLAIKIAPKIGAMDIPKDGRRMHTKSMPRFGGMAIFVGTTASMLIFMHGDPRVPGIVIGGVLIYILGVTDDLKNLPAKAKFLGQTVIAVVMYMYDVRIEFISNFFGDGKSELGSVVCFIVTIIWIVGITNTVNLIDGLDGLAAGTSAIIPLHCLCCIYSWNVPCLCGYAGTGRRGSWVPSVQLLSGKDFYGRRRFSVSGIHALHPVDSGAGKECDNCGGHHSCTGSWGAYLRYCLRYFQEDGKQKADYGG